jgi:predicted DNA-binding mobile mystery protein A
MWLNTKQIIVEQLDSTLAKFSSAKLIAVPVRGWIRAIRAALGMSGKQLAGRLGVTPQRITVLERDERVGNVTLKSMRQAAEALDCIFVYALVPRTSLEQMIREQAEKVASDRLARSSHTMLLENQQLSKKELKKMHHSLVEQIVQSMPKDLWQQQTTLSERRHGDNGGI